MKSSSDAALHYGNPMTKDFGVFVMKFIAWREVILSRVLRLPLALLQQGEELIWRCQPVKYSVASSTRLCVLSNQTLKMSKTLFLISTWLA